MAMRKAIDRETTEIETPARQDGGPEEWRKDVLAAAEEVDLADQDLAEAEAALETAKTNLKAARESWEALVRALRDTVRDHHVGQGRLQFQGKEPTE